MNGNLHLPPLVQPPAPADGSGVKLASEKQVTGSTWPIFGGILAVALALSSQWIVGSVYSGLEARRFLEAMLPTTQTLTFASITASSTILALMLTLLSLTHMVDTDFSVSFYRRIRRIGFLSCIALITSILVLLFLSVPLHESAKVPLAWYRIIYYTVIGLSALISGSIVTIVLMLFNAINSLIDILSPDREEDGVKPLPGNNESQRL